MTTFATHHQITVQGLPTHFVRMGNGKKPVIFLHGWGGSTQSFLHLGHQLIKARPDLELIIVDYPGFGLTEFPKDQAWNTHRYAEWVYDLMMTLNLPQADFYVHSFGGRILTRLQQSYPQVVKKAVLTGAAGIKWPLTARQKLSVLLSKVMPKFERGPLAKLQKFVVTKVLGARDWGNVESALKATLKTVLDEEDVREELPKIETPTLILWGAKDAITPVKSAHVFSQQLPNAQLKVFPNGRHGIHHTHRDDIVKAVADFL